MVSGESLDAQNMLRHPVLSHPAFVVSLLTGFLDTLRVQREESKSSQLTHSSFQLLTVPPTA